MMRFASSPASYIFFATDLIQGAKCSRSQLFDANSSIRNACAALGSTTIERLVKDFRNDCIRLADWEW